MNIEIKVPVLAKEVAIVKQANYYILHQPTYNHRVKVSNEMHALLCEIDGIKSISEVIGEYGRKHKIVLSAQEADTILYGQLGKYGIVESNDITVQESDKPDYLKLSFILVASKVVSVIASYLSFLFSKQFLFFGSALSCIVFNWVLNFNRILQTPIDTFFLSYFILFLASAALHELGHAAATHFFGAKQGGIGIGFYLLFPVCFVDVTDIWSLKPKQRIIVNLAGIYFEYLFCASLTVAGVFFLNNTLITTTTILPVKTLINLLPFIKTDGYWVLSDMLDAPNFQQHADKNVKSFLKGLIKGEEFLCTKQNVLLLIYGIASNLFLVFFLFIMWRDIKFIALSPYHLFVDCRELISGHKSFMLNDFLRYIAPLLLYCTVIHYFKKKIHMVWKRFWPC